jgi:arginyl-tRNA synthetase
MSKRKGNYITVKDLVDEVGKDSVRFMMLNRSSDTELDFDFEKVTEKSKENPVFYVQYAYARINSIFRSLHLDIKKK